MTADELRDYIVHIWRSIKLHYIEFVEFPMNAAGKILKYKMREWAIETGLTG